MNFTALPMEAGGGSCDVFLQGLHVSLVASHAMRSFMRASISAVRRIVRAACICCFRARPPPAAHPHSLSVRAITAISLGSLLLLDAKDEAWKRKLVPAVRPCMYREQYLCAISLAAVPWWQALMLLPFSSSSRSWTAGFNDLDRRSGRSARACISSPASFPLFCRERRAASRLAIVVGS